MGWRAGPEPSIIPGMRSTVAIALTSLALFLPGELQAGDQPVPPELLGKLAATSSRFEAMMHRASFTVTGRMGDVSGDGSLTSPKEGTFRVTMHGATAKVDILKYSEDGEDKIAEAKKKQEERAKEARKPRKADDEIHLPFLETEQAKYDFHIGEVDARDPEHVRVFFHAKAPAENLVNGSSWVDARTGDILTTSVTASKTPAFVDYLRMQFELGEKTSMGPAISKVSFEGAGGFLFIRRHFRGTATLASYAIAP